MVRLAFRMKFYIVWIIMSHGAQIGTEKNESGQLTWI